MKHDPVSTAQRMAFIRYMLFVIGATAAFVIGMIAASGATILSATGPITMSGPITFNATAALPDTNPPVITSATLDWTGTNITLASTEALRCGDDGYGGWTNSSKGVMTYKSGSNTASLVYTVPTAIYSNSTTTVWYTNAGAGWQDAATNLLANTTNISIVNNSTQGVAGGSAFFTETYDATGYDNSTSENGGGSASINEDYTAAPLDGAQSLHFDTPGDTAYTLTSVGTLTEVWGKCMVKPTAVGGVSRISFGTDYWIITINTDRTVRITHGAQTQDSAATMTLNTAYYVKFYFKNNGTSGEATLWFSDTTTFGDSKATFATGNNTSSVTTISMQAYAGAGSIWDSVNLYTSDPGSTF